MGSKINEKYVKQMLVIKDMEQKDLAKASGLTAPTVTRLLQGKPFTSDTLDKLAKALGCHPIDLIQADGFPDPHMEASTADDAVLQPC